MVIEGDGNDSILGTDTPTDAQTGGVQDQQQQPQQGQQPETWDPKPWKMTYKGTEVYPSSREHLVNLAQQGYGYSQSMAQLKKDRQEIESTKTRYQKYDALEAALQANPDLATNIWELVEGRKQNTRGNSEGDDQGFRLPPEVLNKLGEFDKFKSTYEQQRADESLEKEISELRSKYPDQPWDTDTGSGTFRERLLSHALENNILDLRLAYKDLMWDAQMTNVKADALKQNKEQRQKAKAAGVVDAGIPAGAQQRQESTYKHGASYNDQAAAALKALGG